MTLEQKYKLLCQIAHDYGLSKHMEQNREYYQRILGLESWQVGHDIAIIDNLVDGEGLFPVNYELAILRAKERLEL